MRRLNGLAGAMIGFAACLCFASAAAAQVVFTQWNFNTTGLSTSSPAPSLGSGTATPFPLTGPAFPMIPSFAKQNANNQSSDPNPPADGVNGAWQLAQNPPQGQLSGQWGASFAVSTVGFTNIEFFWDHRFSNTSSRFIQAQYSLDGGAHWLIPSGGNNPTDGIYEATSGGDRWYNGLTIDLRNVSGANNNPNLVCRWVSIFNPATGTYTPATATGTYPADGNGGSNRLDMVTFRGNATGSINPSGSGSISPNAVCGSGGSIVHLTVNTNPGQNPFAAVTSVSANLTSIGGASNQAFVDDGTGTGTFVYTTTLGVLTPGLKTMPVTITDSLLRTASTSISLSVADCSVSSSAPVVVSMIYTAGAGTTSPLNSDFIEIFNRSGADQSIDGWSVQYSKAGTQGFIASQVVALSGTMHAGEFRLIQMLRPAPNAGGLPLPSPDFFGYDVNDSAATGVDMDNAGRIAIVSSTTPLLQNCSAAGIVDIVGYGGAAICYEGIAPTLDLSTTTAAIRKRSGCQDSNQTFNDFDVVYPIQPRNGQSPPISCAGNPLQAVGSASPAAGCIGTDTTTISVTVTPGTSPTSSNIQVIGDLSAIGGSAGTYFNDNGNGTYSFQQFIPDTASSGLKTLTVSVIDDQGRNTNIFVPFTTQRCQPTTTAKAEPSALCANGGGAFRMEVKLKAADSPPSTGISVTANLLPVSGASSAQLYDDGTHGDLVAGDGTYTLLVTVPDGLAAGEHDIAYTMVDQQSRSSSGVATFQLVACTDSSSSVVISQVFGGGGNTGSPYRNDYAVLFNRSGATVAIDGWSLQVATNNGNFGGTDTVPLSGTIEPGRSYLVKFGTNGSNGADLPPADATNTAISISNTSAKIALVNSTVTLPIGDCATVIGDASVVDFVGYGGASCYEGASPTAEPSNTLAILRLNNGCTDRDQNGADFALGAPSPLNSLSPAHSCVPLCKPNLLTQNGCLGPVDLLQYLNLYFTNYDGHGSAVPGNNQTLPDLNPTSSIYAVPCTPSAPGVFPVIPASGLKADYDGDCQVGPVDLLNFLHDYFNPAAECFGGCFAKGSLESSGKVEPRKNGAVSRSGAAQQPAIKR